MNNVLKLGAGTVVALFVVGGAAAEARHTRATLSKSEAALVSRLELFEYADHRCSLRYSCDYATYPDLTKYDCRRITRRAVRCEGSVELVERGRYDDYTDYCSASVLVRSGRTPRIRGWDCLDV